MGNGILNINKEKGYTSHDVVAKLRGITKQRKIGHTGTLDPDATGVLPVCFGKATKVCELLTNQEKSYETVLLLGKVTDTQDISGAVITENETKDLSEQQVRDCIQGYIGSYEQLPPMYSALKVQGKKLYELAREGKEVARKTRQVTIYDITILEVSLPRVRMSVHCSKGTYIRTLCHDIGEILGCGGCMEELVRTTVGRFNLTESYTLAQVEDFMKQGRLDEVLLPIDEMFLELTAVTIFPIFESLAYNGNDIPIAGIEATYQPEEGERVRLYDSKDRFVGIYNWHKEQFFRVEKFFFSAE